MAYALRILLLVMAVAAAVLEAGPATAAAKEAPLRFRLLSVYDKGVGTEAFRMLIPTDWKAEGGIVWRHEFSNLATVAMRLSKPNSPEALEMFPITPHVWREGGIVMFPPGTNYLGNVVLPVVADPATYIQQVVLQQFRKNANPRIVGRKSLPDVAKTVAAAVQEAGTQKTVKAERVRLEYQEGGRAIEEDVYCVLVYTQIPVLPGTTFWTAERLFSFKAAKGNLDGMGGLLQTMAASVKVNPVWFSKYQQVLAQWQQSKMQSIRSAGELSRYIARTSNEISAMSRQAYEARQASNDRINKNFSEYIRGVETYHNPVESRAVELPSGYREVWVSGNGEYILSNDSNFNPNVGSTQNWQRMKHAR
jgi:hypothetical protein